jgi:hypothetical protein
MRAAVSRYAPKQRRISRVGLVWTLLWSALSTASMKSPEPPRLAIRLVNTHHVTAETLARAEEIAGRAFSQAGVDIVWVHCRTGEPANPCREAPARSDLWVQIFDRRPANLRGETAGFAVVYRSADGGLDGYAAVSFPHVRTTSAACAQPIASMLAAAIAHEAGHLLLGAKAHSARGVMSRRIGCEELRRATRGELIFQPREAQQLREEAARRHGR